MTTTKTAAFIFARGGSKGLPGKNLIPLAGRSLLQHAIDAARKTRGIDRVIVSTDSSEIAVAARQGGAEVPFMRPPELATDTAPEWLSWQHAITWLRETEGAGSLERFVSVPTTSPLRSPLDIEACLDAFDSGTWDAVLTVRPAERNPYFNMVTLDENREAQRVAKYSAVISGRQAAPAMYDVTTVAYVARPDFVTTASSLFDGRIGAVVVPKERAIDIDDSWDLLTAEAYLAHKTSKGTE